jgi:chromate transporter
MRPAGGRVVRDAPVARIAEREVVARQTYSLAELTTYFLRLGTVGFGGPIALCGYMQRDLVERRRWISPEDYKEGLALAQLAPGPLAAQLAIYLGWVRARVRGATVVGLAFILPSFVMVLALSALYLRYGGLTWMQGAFYGIGAATIAIIARSAWKLVRLTLARDRLLWAICLASAAITAWTESEILWVFLAGGLIPLAVRARPGATALLAVPPWLLLGLHGPAPAHVLWQIAWFFTEAGAFIFGSGLAIVPFLYGGVVQEYGWLNDQQFLDAVAVAMLTPGPVVITVAFIGYLVASTPGAIVAAIGIFVPVYLFVVIPFPWFDRFSDNPQVKAFVGGVTAAASGAIAGACFVLARRAFVDVPTLLIGLVALGVLWRFKVPEPVLIGAGAAAGLLIFALRA